MRHTIITALIGALCFVGASLADENDKKTTITVNETILVPGKQLPPGKYVMKLANVTANRHVVQIFNEDQTELQATILAFPNERVQREGETVLTYWETPAGSPPALRAWFWPGDTTGQEFAYPREAAERIARANQNAAIMSYEATGELTAENAATIEMRGGDSRNAESKPQADSRSTTNTDNGNPIVNGAEAAGRAAGAGAGAVVNGAEATGRVVAEGAKAVGEGTVEGAKAVGEVTVEGAKAVGEGTAAAAQAVGQGAVTTGRVIGETAKGAAEGAKEGFQDARDGDEAREREESRQREITDSERTPATAPATTGAQSAPRNNAAAADGTAPATTTPDRTAALSGAERQNNLGQADRSDPTLLAQNEPTPRPVTPNNQAPAAGQTAAAEDSELPQTASPVFLILAAGLASLFGAITIRRLYA